MRTFEIEDLTDIINYIKSLDIYSQFDEIVIIPITDPTSSCRRITSIEIRIKADDRLFLVYAKRRVFTVRTIDLDQYFEQDLKKLSASILFGRTLIQCIESLDRYDIYDSSRVNSIIAESKDSNYTLQVYLTDEEAAVANISATFEIDHDSFDSSHEFKAKSSVKIEELKEDLEKFEKLKNLISFD